MFQIIINHSGLSLGEIEAINNLFSDYSVYENTTDNDFDYASVLEFEFVKYKKIPFFDFISIEKWTLLIEIIKNIKKRRGSKGLKFAIKITNVDKFIGDDDDDDEIGGEEKSTIFNITVFLLNHKKDLDFIKGLERIEIMIENIVEMYTYEYQKVKEEQLANNTYTKDKIRNKIESKDEDIMILRFDEINRKWTRSR